MFHARNFLYVAKFNAQKFITNRNFDIQNSICVVKFHLLNITHTANLNTTNLFNLFNYLVAIGGQLLLISAFVRII